METYVFPFLEVREQALLYRDLYAAILNGALQERGRKEEYAALVKRTNVWVSMIRKEVAYPSRRNQLDWSPPPQPALDRAKRYADAAYWLDDDLRERLKHYLELAHPSYFQKHAIQRSWNNAPPAKWVLMQLQQALEQASWTTDRWQATALYDRVRMWGAAQLATINPRLHPLDFAHICFNISSAALTQHYPDQGFFYTNLALRVLRHEDIMARQYDPDRWLELNLIVLQAQANMLHHLRAYRESHHVYERVAADPVFKHYPGMWQTSMNRDHIASLTYIRGLRGSVIDRLAAEVNVQTDDPLQLLLIDRAQASAYRQLGRLAEARAIIEPYLATAGLTSPAGPLIQSMIYQTYAQICRTQGDTTGEHETALQSYKIAQNAGLMDRMHSLERQFTVLSIKNERR